MRERRAAGRLILLIVPWVVSVILAWTPLPSRATTGASATAGLTIRVEGGNWGSARREEIEALLYAVADELVGGPSPVFDHPVVVTYAPGNPVTLYERGPNGEYLVHLSARDRRWAQFAYQFGHELCHILSNFGSHADKTARKRNQWFEEALCETAGVFALRSMARSWPFSAPLPGWEDYAPTLRAYADALTGAPHRRLPEGFTPARWLQANLQRLTRDPYLRDRNEVVANLMLPLFEKAPRHWSALHYLNLDPRDPGADLSHYLGHWLRNAPQAHKPFIRELVARLGVRDREVMLVATEGMIEPEAASADVAQAGAPGLLDE